MESERSKHARSFNIVKRLPINTEEYRVLVLSTSHLSKNDMEEIDIMINLKGDPDGMYDECDCNMVLARDTGYFIKLYSEDTEGFNYYSNFSDELNIILISACSMGYCLVEFDRDANVIDEFKEFEEGE